MENWKLETAQLPECSITDIEAPRPVISRRCSGSTTDWDGNLPASHGRRRDVSKVRGDGSSSTGSEAQRTTTGASRQSTEERWTNYNLIVELATSLLQYGAPSHRIEVIVSAIASALSTQAAFYYLPSYAIIQFPTLSSSGNVNGPSSLYLIKSRGSMNFHKLPQVYDLVKEILRNGVGCEEIRSRLEKIRSKEEKEKEFPEWAIALSYPVAAMTSAVMFFHGSWREAGVSAALGVIPGLLRLVANRFESLWWTYEIISCFLISIIATKLSPHFCYSTVILSAPVALLPGYTVTAAIVEIMTKNLIAGSVRLCYTIVYLGCMIFGLTFGSIIYHAQGNTSGIGFERKPSEEICLQEGKIHPNHLWLFLCVPLYIAAYNVYLRSPLHQWPPMLLIGSLGYLAGYSSKHIWHSPPEFNGFAAALTIGLLANLYSRFFDKFSFNTIVAGIFIQVPGSWGARGMLALAYAEYERGLYYCYMMVSICVGISAALLISNYIVLGFKQQNRGIPHMDF